MCKISGAQYSLSVGRSLPSALVKVSADACYERRTNAEFLKFLKLVANLFRLFAVEQNP